jgi:hypothetical protein
MTVDPRSVVEALGAGSGPPDPDGAPILLRRSPEPRAPLAPVQAGPEVASVHQRWAAVHGKAEPADADGEQAGLRARMRSRVMGVAAEAAGGPLRDDRALIGDLIRALDAVAHRVDELAGRLSDLEAVVQEGLAVLGEDVVRLRARAIANAAAAPPGTSRARTAKASAPKAGASKAGAAKAET